MSQHTQSQWRPPGVRAGDMRPKVRNRRNSSESRSSPLQLRRNLRIARASQPPRFLHVTRSRTSIPAGRCIPTTDAAWRAIVERDARYDTRFVYGVSSTGVFCHPSCASRRPRRDRVRIFTHAEAAVDAGFRACKRCCPGSDYSSRGETAVARATAYLQSHADRRVTLADLAADVDLSPYHLQRTFKQSVGISPREYHDALRKRRFTERLRAGDTVSRATYQAGYGSSSRVYGRREVRAGMTPAVYRRKAVGKQIRFTTVGVPMGRMLVAFTDEGVCALELGDSDEMLERTLREDFSSAEIERTTDHTDSWVAAIVRQTRGHAPASAVPLDVQGTAFQWKVWKALQRIPIGETRSYAAVARSIGKPKAVRAVANACARNPVAVVVPCHRVVTSAGELGGYRWGPDVKAQLLESECRLARK